ncbi:MAG: helix-turn-helix domain-containing protein [Candidatus Jorgensenbacteria bacterium]|nr:helix-turn-helix domain-containing protein [Candidatus Jorgensenbacteria bacterium]
MEHEYEERRLSHTIAEAMKVKGLTVTKLSEATGVSERIVELILAERFDELPPAPYVRGYLLKIAEVLGHEGNSLWDAYGKYHAEIRRSGRTDILPENRFALPKISRKLVLGVGLSLLILGFIASRFFWGGRTFIFEVNIPENLVVATSTYALEGRVRAGDQLTLNGVSLNLDLDGVFAREWNLVSGFNTLRFVVVRPLEGEREFVKQIFYEPRTEPSTFPPSLSPTQ